MEVMVGNFCVITNRIKMIHIGDVTLYTPMEKIRTRYGLSSQTKTCSSYSSQSYPRDSIHFFHEKHGSDQHLTSAFRHHIEIPDEMFPLQWRSNRSSVENW